MTVQCSDKKQNCTGGSGKGQYIGQKRVILSACILLRVLDSLGYNRAERDKKLGFIIRI